MDSYLGNQRLERELFSINEVIKLFDSLRLQAEIEWNNQSSLPGLIS